jgi:hypothetical protein
VGEDKKSKWMGDRRSELGILERVSGWRIERVSGWRIERVSGGG